MHVTVTKITNGYLVTTVGDDGTPAGTKAVLKTTVGNVPAKQVGLAITGVLGRVTTDRKTRKKRVAKVAAGAAA